MLLLLIFLLSIISLFLLRLLLLLFLFLLLLLLLLLLLHAAVMLVVLTLCVLFLVLLQYIYQNTTCVFVNLHLFQKIFKRVFNNKKHFWRLYKSTKLIKHKNKFKTTIDEIDELIKIHEREKVVYISAKNNYLPE